MLGGRSPEHPLYRIARGANPWEYPDWSKASKDSTFGNRFDDPNGEYRVLYAATQLTSCYVETLARFRPDAHLIGELKRIRGEDDFTPAGTVPREWFASRVIGVARVTGTYADLYSPEWISYLRPKLQPLCVECGLPDFDLSILMQAEKRIITQTASSYVKDLGSFAGIYYASRYGLGLENWALFEDDAVISPMPNRPVSPSLELKRALELLDLKADMPEWEEYLSPRGNTGFVESALRFLKLKR